MAVNNKDKIIKELEKWYKAEAKELEEYEKWAYWCPNKRCWFASKCECYDKK